MPTFRKDMEPLSYTLKMEEACSSETLEWKEKNMEPNNPEDDNLKIARLSTCDILCLHRWTAIAVSAL
jgi:hypothetical protein